MDKRNQYFHSRIGEVIEHSSYMRSFVISTTIQSKPGQFVMVWLPGTDEKPISLSGKNRITVKKVGPFTKKLFEKKEGDYLDIRGPYGNSFPLVGFSTLIGGGCGIAPLAYLFSECMLPGMNFVLAGKTKEDLIFLEDILNISEESKSYAKNNIVCVTENGSLGIKGMASDIDIPKSGGNYCLCGPEIMMKQVAEKLVKEDIPANKIYLSMERYMKCAVGVCGNCSFSGYRVCADGPVFRYNKIKDLPHFNEFGRWRTGEIRKLEELRPKRC